MKATILKLIALLFFAQALMAQQTVSQSRQIWTEYAPTPEAALQLAKRRLPPACETSRIETASLPEGNRYQKHSIQYQGYPVYGKQLVVAPVNGGSFAAAYPRYLPKAVKLEIDENAWQIKLDAILEDGAFRYRSHSYAIVPEGLDFDLKTFALAVVIELDITNTHRHDRLYLSASDGTLIARHPIDCTFVPGTAQTLNYGQQTIETSQDGPNGQYRLYDALRGDGIQTVGADLEDIYDTDNNWAFDTDSLTMALDVHHGLGVTHDFLKQRFGRIGLDGNGVFIQASTGIPFANAYYGGPENIGIGAGDPNTSLDRPLSSIDIVAHEMAHGVTAFSSNLIYFDESGGLNEAFSDILGVTIQYDEYGIDGLEGWTLGEEASSAGTYIRNMADPNELGMPDTYGGNFWSPGLEVHTGSSIANYWFYLIVDGDSGTNDVGYEYNVPGLGYYEAIDIVYDTWNNRLSESSNYADCSIATIAAATELFGACSPQVLAVEEAWRAVNVTAGILGVGEASMTRVCDPGIGIIFIAEVPGTFIDWQFGDGEYSTDNPATHTYLMDGEYMATYRFTNCAGDTIIADAINSVTVNTDNPDVCNFFSFNESSQTLDNCAGILVDDGGENGDYSNNQFSEIILSRDDISGYRFTFDAFSLEFGYDFLLIVDENDQLVADLTGNLITEDIEVLGNSVSLFFSSDSGGSDEGFVISFSCFSPTATPVAGIISDDYPDCRSMRVYTSDSEQYPDQFLWTIDGEAVSIESELIVNWSDYGPGTYTLTLEACNSFGCDQTTYPDIVITEEIGTCESINMETGSFEINGCLSNLIYDDGGPDGNYSDGINSTVHVSNDENRNIQLDFLELSLEGGYDYLYIYDNSLSNPILLDQFSGSFPPFMEEYETSDLSIVFTTDGSVTYPGFVIEAGCAEPNSILNDILDINWQVSPNPFDQSLVLRGIPNGDWTFELQTTDGRIVKSWSGIRTSAGGTLTLDTESLPAATYILLAKDEERGLAVKRVIKQ